MALVLALTCRDFSKYSQSFSNMGSRCCNPQSPCNCMLVDITCKLLDFAHIIFEVLTTETFEDALSCSVMSPSTVTN